MGMYDSIRFAYRMPDGYERWNFQTKDLDCACDSYEIDANGRLVRLSSCGYPDDVLLPLGDLNYVGELNIYAEWGAWHEYDLTFVDGTLTLIRCRQAGIELLFDPAEVGLHHAQACEAMKTESERLLAQMDQVVAERKAQRKSLFE